MMRAATTCLLQIQQVKKYHLHLNRNKSSRQTEIKYLGYIVELNKISKSLEKVKDIPRPSNVSNLCRFLGMITYYSCLLPDNSIDIYTLRQLLRKKTTFQRTAAHEITFTELKLEISSDKAFVFQQPSIEIIFTMQAQWMFQQYFLTQLMV